MRSLFIFLCLILNTYALEVQQLSWPKGTSFLSFLQNNDIPLKLYYDLDKEAKELCSEIQANIQYQVLKDDQDVLQQVLIPISEEMQLHVYKNADEYKFDVRPIQFEEVIKTVAIPIKYSPYQDILDNTKNSKLANEFLRAFSKSVNFRRMRAGNYVAIKYKQRIRMGEYYGVPQVIAAMVEVGRKKYFIFKNDKDGRFYNEKGKSLTSYIFKTPVRYTRISSKFTKKRWHPVLKRYRAHLGVDYAAPRGRPIYAAGDGRIIHRGNKGGYGKTIMIQHKHGYRTLYAHQNRFKAGLRVGSRVRKGQHIGYVGNTGLSSGPHLHLGLYKNGRAVNPLRIIRITKSKLKGKAKRKFLAHTKVLSKELLDTMKSNTEPFKLEKINPKTLLAKSRE